MSIVEQLSQSAAQRHRQNFEAYRDLLNNPKADAQTIDAAHELLTSLGKTVEDVKRDLELIVAHRQMKALAARSEELTAALDEANQAVHRHYKEMDEVQKRMEKDHQVLVTKLHEAGAGATAAQNAANRLFGFEKQHAELLGFREVKLPTEPTISELAIADAR